MITYIHSQQAIKGGGGDVEQYEGRIRLMTL